MPDLQEIRDTEITISVLIYGHTIHVSYKPLMLSTSEVTAIARIEGRPADKVYTEFVKMFCRLVTMWDITEKKEGLGEVPVPITLARLRNNFPVDILSSVSEACMYDKKLRGHGALMEQRYAAELADLRKMQGEEEPAAEQAPQPLEEQEENSDNG